MFKFVRCVPKKEGAKNIHTYKHHNDSISHHDTCLHLLFRLPFVVRKFFFFLSKDVKMSRRTDCVH